MRLMGCVLGALRRRSKGSCVAEDRTHGRAGWRAEAGPPAFDRTQQACRLEPDMSLRLCSCSRRCTSRRQGDLQPKGCDKPPAWAVEKSISQKCVTRHKRGLSGERQSEACDTPRAWAVEKSLSQKHATCPKRGLSRRALVRTSEACDMMSSSPPGTRAGPAGRMLRAHVLR